MLIVFMILFALGVALTGGLFWPAALILVLCILFWLTAVWSDR